jgi:hypothetical protein
MMMIIIIIISEMESCGSWPDLSCRLAAERGKHRSTKRRRKMQNLVKAVLELALTPFARLTLVLEERLYS